MKEEKVVEHSFEKQVDSSVAFSTQLLPETLTSQNDLPDFIQLAAHATVALKSAGQFFYGQAIEIRAIYSAVIAKAVDVSARRQIISFIA